MKIYEIRHQTGWKKIKLTPNKYRFSYTYLAFDFYTFRIRLVIVKMTMVMMIVVTSYCWGHNCMDRKPQDLWDVVSKAALSWLHRLQTFQCGWTNELSTISLTTIITGWSTTTKTYQNKPNFIWCCCNRNKNAGKKRGGETPFDDWLYKWLPPFTQQVNEQVTDSLIQHNTYSFRTHSTSFQWSLNLTNYSRA